MELLYCSEATVLSCQFNLGLTYRARSSLYATCVSHDAKISGRAAPESHLSPSSYEDPEGVIEDYKHFLRAFQVLHNCAWSSRSDNGLKPNWSFSNTATVRPRAIRRISSLPSVFYYRRNRRPGCLAPCVKQGCPGPTARSRG